MSRLQKKKPMGEKKKQRAEAENKAALSVSSHGFSSSKSATKAGTLKTRSEKKLPGKNLPGKNLTDTKPSEPNVFQRAMDFFREVKMELKKVTWPTRKQTSGTTVVVIIFVFVIAVFLGLFDFGLSKLVQVVLT